MSDKLEKPEPETMRQYGRHLPDGVILLSCALKSRFFLYLSEAGDKLTEVDWERAQMWKTPSKTMAYVAQRAMIIRERGWEFHPKERSEKR